MIYNLKKNNQIKIGAMHFFIHKQTLNKNVLLIINSFIPFIMKKKIMNFIIKDLLYKNFITALHGLMRCLEDTPTH